MGLQLKKREKVLLSLQSAASLREHPARASRQFYRTEHRAEFLSAMQIHRVQLKRPTRSRLLASLLLAKLPVAEQQTYGSYLFRQMIQS